MVRFQTGVVVILMILYPLSIVVGAEDAKDKEVLKANSAADTRYNFGGFHFPGNWYKGNLHLHSTMSDGKFDPQTTVEVYRKAGYDFIALSDHIWGFWDKQKKEYRPLIYPLDILNKPGFLVIPAIEYDTTRNGETIHMVAVGPGYDRRMEKEQDPSAAMKMWWDAGAFAFFAHPHWSLDATEVLESMTFLPAVEVFNYATALEEGIRGNSQLHWDRLLRLRRPVLGVATDDSHRAGTDSCGGWVMVKTKELTAEAVVTALRGGNFYFSSGPRLEQVYADAKGNLHIECSPVRTIRAMAGVGQVASVSASKGKTIDNATLEWGTKWPFVRVECVDEEGRTAWSQGVLRTKETTQE